MILPTEETLLFYREIDGWIQEDDRSNGLVYVFKKDTPQAIIDKFEEIKDKINYKIDGYRIAD